jgi:hypothetical protein
VDIQTMLTIMEEMQQHQQHTISTTINTTLSAPTTTPASSNSFPLKAGLYNLVPREWLRLWRRYVKDISFSELPILDCTRLLCHAHGLLLIPPHVLEYFVGIRSSLFNGLGNYPGELVEILTAEEWDHLQQETSIAAYCTDFSVRFCVIVNEQEENQQEDYQVTWNLPICETCDPLLPPTPLIKTKGQGRGQCSNNKVGNGGNRSHNGSGNGSSVEPLIMSHPRQHNHRRHHLNKSLSQLQHQQGGHRLNNRIMNSPNTNNRSRSNSTSSIAEKALVILR